MLRLNSIYKQFILLICIILIFSLVSIVTGYGDRTGWAWHKKYASYHSLNAWSVLQTTDKGYILGGEYGGDSSGSLLIKTDAMGNPEWSKEFDIKTLYDFQGMSQSSDGGYFLVGILGEKLSPPRIIKTDAQGNLQWVAEIPNKWGFTWGNPLSLPEGGCIYVLNINSQYSALQYEVELGKVDRNGAVLWTKKYNKGDSTYLKSIISTSDEGFLLGVQVTPYPQSEDVLSGKVWLIKTDSNGQEQWSHIYDFQDIYAIHETSDGGYVFAYKTYQQTSRIVSMPHYEEVLGVIKIDLKGTPQWTKPVNNNGLPYFTFNGVGRPQVHPTLDGGFIFLSGGILLKIDASGNIEWKWTFKESDDIEQIFRTRFLEQWQWGAGTMRQINAMQPTSDGGYILAGLYKLMKKTEECKSPVSCKFLVENDDAWLIKIDKTSNPSPKIEPSERIFLASGNLPGLSGFDSFISLIGIGIAIIYCKLK